MPEHDLLENSVAAYVLGALEPEEEGEVGAHIQACAGCRQLADRVGRAVAVLPLSVQELKPPARLRERILAAAAAAPREQLEPARQRNLIRLPRRQGSHLWARFRTGVPGYAAAVAVLAVGLLGLAAWDVSLSRQLQAQQQTASSLRFNLHGVGSMATASATVTSIPSDDLTVVSFQNLPRLQPGRVYQIWLIPASGVPASAGVFTPDPDGSKTLVVNQSLAAYRQVAVTTELGPAGAPAPTQKPELVGQVA